MAFPSDLEIEVAFNNDIDETLYAQSGWTSILPYVASFSGDLRGRAYELDRSEAGSLSVTLDNQDGRFLPGSIQSPYFPNVKSDRRFRIRGKNMAHPNVARGGSRDRGSTGFMAGIPGTTVSTSFTTNVYGMDEVRSITASAEPNAPAQGKEKVLDGLKATFWSINTQAGSLTVQFGLSVRMQRYTLSVPAGNPTRNPKTWTLQGSTNGTTFTTIHTVSANTWTDDYETQTFTITSPGFYVYYKLDITANTGAVTNTQLSEFQLLYNDAATDLILDDDLTHYVEVRTNASLALNQWYETASWYVPLEYGVRLAHSALVWRISGTEPTGAMYKLHVTYLDSDLNQVGSTEGVADPSQIVSTLPTSTTPTQIGFSHTPPSTAKYGVVSLAIWIGGTTNSTALVYGITGIQSELPVNLAPDISGFRDTFNWQIESASTVTGSVLSVNTSSGTGTIVEATSPAYVSGNTATVTTASFTPANNSLLVAMVGFGNGSFGTSALGTVTDSLAGTWTRLGSDFSTTGGVAEIWARDVVTGAAMTVSYARGGTATASGVGMKVKVLTGAKAVASQTGASATIGGTSAFKKAITTTFANSRVYGSFARPATPVTLAPISGTTIEGQIAGSSGDASSAFDGTTAISIPSSNTYGFVNTDTSGNRMILKEILATSQAASDPTTSYLSVTWGVNDSNLYITLPHLIPGESYTATVQAQIVGTQPTVLFSADEGLSGQLISTTTMTQYTLSFVADQAEQELRFILQGTPTATEGLRIRKLNVQYGANLSLTLPTTATETGFTTWTRPKDIFEGWVETWPAVAGSNSMTITVVDRMKRIGEVELANTLREALLVDSPGLLLPLSDSMIDTPGRFSQLGYWGDDTYGGPTYVDISHSRGDVSSASYSTTSSDGPTGEAALESVTGLAGGAVIGYFLSIPYSKEYATPLPGVTPVPKPKPPAPAKTIYTKKWYATWSRSYDSSGATRFDDSPYMYQGEFPGGPLNQKSLAGLDYKNIRSTLYGAEILSASLTVTNDHARWNRGLTVQLGTHTYTSKPSTFSTANVQESKWAKFVGEGNSVTADMGTATGRAFRDGGINGICIGPDSNPDNYGYFRGATQSNRPFITIQYRK
jgi:hypothetical protein